MNALFIILLALFPSAITSPIPDGAINQDIVNPIDVTSIDVALANFASKEDPFVNAIDEDSTSTESTLTNPESVASNPNCDTGSQSQGYLQSTGELSTRTSSATPAILAAAVQGGSCPNPVQGSGNSADASEEVAPTEEDRRYNEHSQRKRKLCCRHQPREIINIVGNLAPLVNYGVCRQYNRNMPICQHLENLFLCFKFYNGFIFNRQFKRVTSTESGYGWGQYCIPGFVNTYD